MALSNSPVLFMATRTDGSIVGAGRDFIASTFASGIIANRIQAKYRIRGIAAGSDGSVYVANDHHVRKLDSSLKLLWESTAQTAEADIIRAVGVDANGTVYVAGERFLSTLAADGGRWLARRTSDCNASALTIDNSGAVYIAGTNRASQPVSADLPKRAPQKSIRAAHAQCGPS